MRRGRRLSATTRLLRTRPVRDGALGGIGLDPADGILEREPSPEHGRILHNRLTAAGKKLLASALRVAGQIEGELLVNVDDKKLSLLQEVLVELWERAEKHELHPGAIRAKADEMVRAQLPVRRRGSRQGVRTTPRRSRAIDAD